MKNIMVIGAGEYQISGIRKLKEKGYRVIAIDENSNAIGKEIADVFYVVDIKNSSRIIELIENKKIELHSCMSFATEIAIRQVAEINEHYSLVGIKTAMARLGTDKGLQREIIKKHGLPSPKFILVKKDSNIEELIQENNMKYPLMIKPVDNSGSRGVVYVSSRKDLENNLDKCFNFAIFNSQIIIEEYITGVELTIETIVSNGKIITLGISEKKKPIGNYTVSIELFYNSPFVKNIQSKIESIVNTFINVSGFNNTILHTEAIYSFYDENIYIIETAVRSGGFNIFDKILPLVTGSDIVSITIDVNLGKNIIFKPFNNRACILRFFSGNPGTLQSINVQDEIIEPLEEIEYGFFIKQNEKVGILDSDGSRLGYLISSANTWEEAFEKANLIEYAIKINTV